MKLIAVIIAGLSLSSAAWPQGQHIENGRKPETMPTVNDIMTVAPALRSMRRALLPTCGNGQGSRRGTGAS